jgi:hypothetical protein
MTSYWNANSSAVSDVWQCKRRGEFAHVVMAALGMRYGDLRRFALSRDGPVPDTKSSSSTRHPLVAIFVASCNGHDGSVGRSVICG